MPGWHDRTRVRHPRAPRRPPAAQLAGLALRRRRAGGRHGRAGRVGNGWMTAPGSTRCRAGCTVPTRCWRRLVELAPWRQRKVTMWGRLLDEPRLTAWWPITGQATCRCPSSPTCGPRCAEVRRALRLRRGQPLPRRARQRRLARRPDRPHLDRAGRGHREPRRAPAVPRPASRRWPVAVVRAGRRRPVRDGRSLPARLGAHGAQGRRRRAAAVADLSPRSARGRATP